MSDEEFSLALGMGVVTGARSFLIDALGRLTGVAYPQVWTPGENVAVCKAPHYANTVSPTMSYTTRTYSVSDVRTFDSVRRVYTMFDGYEMSESMGMQLMSNGGRVAIPIPTAPSVAIEKPKAKPKDHGLKECTHGFYGYYDGSNDYYREGYVSGVVEGYGETIIGTRGFRVMKAKLVALSIDDKVKTPLRRLVLRNYKDVPQFEKFEDMIKAFPTDPGESEISPEKDADFWTRTI